MFAVKSVNIFRSLRKSTWREGGGFRIFKDNCDISIFRLKRIFRAVYLYNLILKYVKIITSGRLSILTVTKKNTKYRQSIKWNITDILYCAKYYFILKYSQLCKTTKLSPLMCTLRKDFRPPSDCTGTKNIRKWILFRPLEHHIYNTGYPWSGFGSILLYWPETIFTHLPALINRQTYRNQSLCKTLHLLTIF